MARSQDLLGVDDQLCFALYTASRAMVSAYQPVLGPLGLTYPQYLVMLVLWEEGSVHVSRLGDRLDLDSGTLTPLLKRMESQGLVARRRSEEDQRVVHVDLTPAGKSLRRRAQSVTDAMMCKTAMPIGDLASLRKTLRALASRLRTTTEK